MSDAGTPLDDAKYIALETFKKDGTGVQTPVWTAPLDGKLVVFSEGKAWKVKRLRNNPKLRAAACDMRGGNIGTWYEGEGRIVDDSAWIARAEQAFAKKYGLVFTGMNVFAKLVGRAAKRAWIELSIGEK